MGIPKVKSSSELRNNLSETIREVNEGQEHIISHKSGNIVLVSESSYAKLRKELEDLKLIAIGTEELNTGKGVSHSNAKKTLNKLKNKWR